MNEMDYKVRRIYLLILSKDPSNWKVTDCVEAKKTLKSLIDFKRRYPTRKCLAWVPK